MNYGATDQVPSAGRDDNDTSMNPSSTQSPENEAESSSKKTLWMRLMNFYERNFGLFLVFLAQTCGSLVG